MKIRKFSREGNLVSLEIEEESEEFRKFYQKTAKGLAEQTKIKGFRPGKAPIQVIEQHFSQGEIVKEANNALISDCYRRAIEEKSLSPIDYPKNVKIIEQVEGQPVIFSLQVEVKPEVKLGQYKKIKAKRKKVQIDETAVSQQIEAVRERLAEYVPVAPRPVKDGDLLRVDMEANFAGGKYEPWSRQDAGLAVGSGQISPQFDKEIVGLSIGETKKFSVEFPADYPGKEVASQKVDFQVTVKEIREKKLPQVNDELAAKLGPFHNMDQAKENLRKALLTNAEQESRQKLQEEVLQKIVAEAQTAVPEIMVNRQIDNLMERLKANLGRNNLTLEDYLKYRQKDEKSLREEFRENAAGQVKTALILEEIAKVEAIKVEEKDLDEEVLVLAKETGQPVDKVKKNLKPENLEFIRDYLMDRKTIQFLLDQAQIEEEK